MINQIHWLGHASFRIEGDLHIYIDPFRILDDNPPADVILITHEHYDHCSPVDIEKLLKPSTRIISNQAVADLLRDEIPGIQVLRQWQSLNVGRVNIKAVPAYTFDDYHPPRRGDLGFVVSMNFHDIYYAGDTDFIPDMQRIGCDIAILPVSAKEGLMTIDNARRVVESVRPAQVIPSHYDSPEGGSRLDARALETALKGLSQVAWLNNEAAASNIG